MKVAASTMRVKDRHENGAFQTDSLLHLPDAVIF
jgi:hypothetical protein